MYPPDSELHTLSRPFENSRLTLGSIVLTDSLKFLMFGRNKYSKF